MSALTSHPLIDHDPWLKPYEDALLARHAAIESRLEWLLADQTPAEFALGFQRFGLHRTADGWVFREWAPNATQLYLVGDFSEWQERPEFGLHYEDNGQWALRLPPGALRHGQRYNLHIYWAGGEGWRLPSYATRVVQQPHSVEFVAEVWDRPNFVWQHQSPTPPQVPLIYEAHVGMSSEAETVANFDYFRTKILPRITRAGYNTVQIMAIAEHPYYASFGYHVSNFFAVSSRFGTPDEFKQLVDAAHGLGLRVIVDLVHSHTVKNEVEGLGQFDGTQTQYCHQEDHPAWDSRLFDYGKPEVMHFLASNCRWWLDEYHVDGFRFDGVTSMIYRSHGLGQDFTSYDDYFTDDIDNDALVYLQLANQVVHAVRPDATTIAEEMSGLPGLAAPVEQGGIGFDYRLHMGAPDIWIKTLKERPDENWDIGAIVHTLSLHRPEEKVISYAESHDQALVGDKTLIFRLIDAAMYHHMNTTDPDPTVERGIALHKLIRLLTAGLHGGGWLNFMGNEFGHPEWIDFPRPGNDWSYHYARRQWSLVDNDSLKYQWLGAFDRALMATITSIGCLEIHHLCVHQADMIVSFMRGDVLFCSNFSPNTSYTDYLIEASSGSYRLVLSTNSPNFGGQDYTQQNQHYLTKSTPGSDQLQIYIPARCGLILKKVN